MLIYQRSNIPKPQYMAALIEMPDPSQVINSLNRLQLTPLGKVQLYNSDGSKSRKALVEQCIVAGNENTAIYSKIQD